MTTIAQMQLAKPKPEMWRPQSAIDSHRRRPILDQIDWSKFPPPPEEGYEDVQETKERHAEADKIHLADLYTTFCEPGTVIESTRNLSVDDVQWGVDAWIHQPGMYDRGVDFKTSVRDYWWFDNYNTPPVAIELWSSLPPEFDRSLYWLDDPAAQEAGKVGWSFDRTKKAEFIQFMYVSRSKRDRWRWLVFQDVLREACWRNGRAWFRRYPVRNNDITRGSRQNFVSQFVYVNRKSLVVAMDRVLADWGYESAAAYEAFRDRKARRRLG
jgi:hypothetical protein